MKYRIYRKEGVAAGAEWKTNYETLMLTLIHFQHQTPNTKHINTYHLMNVNVHMCTHVAPPALSVVHVDKMMYVCVVPGKVMNKK